MGRIHPGLPWEKEGTFGSVGGMPGGRPRGPDRDPWVIVTGITNGGLEAGPSIE